MPFKDPVRMAEYMRNMRKRKVAERVSVNPSVNPVNRKKCEIWTPGEKRKPVNPSVNPMPARYILSYSRSKYQFVLYRVVDEKKVLEGSKTKREAIIFKDAIVELTWGPDILQPATPEEAKERIEQRWAGKARVK